jgi:hypothetical protein
MKLLKYNTAMRRLTLRTMSVTALLLLVIVESSSAADITPPQLQSLSISQTTVDVSTESQTIDFTARITDDLSGCNWGVVTITSPSKSQQFSSPVKVIPTLGTVHDGVWIFPVTIDKSSETGIWSVEIFLQDADHNDDFFTGEQGIQVIADITPPQLQSLLISPPIFDADAQSQTINFTAHITDNLSGMNSGLIEISSPSGPSGIQSSSANAVFSSGTPCDGVWIFPVTIYNSSETGTWHVTQIRLQDSAGNESLLIPQPGDVNLSGNVDITDAILSLQALTGMAPAGTVFREADVNGDDKIGMAEVIYTLQKAAGMR